MARGAALTLRIVAAVSYLSLTLSIRKLLWKVRFRASLRGLPKDLRDELYRRYSELLDEVSLSPASLLRYVTTRRRR